MDKALFMLFDMGLTLLLVIIIVFIAIFAVHINQFNTFEDQAQDTISRSGGFTQDVQDELNNQAGAYYKSGGVNAGSGKPMFQVEPYDYVSKNNNDGKEILSDGSVLTNGETQFVNQHIQGLTGDAKKKADKTRNYETVSYGSPIRYRVIARIPFIPIFKNTTLIFNLNPYTDNAQNGDGEEQEVTSEVREGSSCFVNNSSNNLDSNSNDDSTCSTN